MPTFDSLIKSALVKNHPLLKGYRDLPKMREVMERHAQALEEASLVDMLTPLGEGEQDKGKNLNGMIYEASMLVQDVFSQFNIPIHPKFFYETSRDVKYARNDENRVIEGSLIFGAEFRSTLGVRKRATIAVPISAGELVTPSVMEVDGRVSVISQSALDDILKRNSTYELPQLRDHYQQPPLTKAEREIAVDIRNEQGWQPRKNPGEYYLNQKLVEARRKLAAGQTPRMWSQVVEAMEQAAEDGLDTFPRTWTYVLHNYILEHVATASKDAWEPHLINEGFCLNPYGGNMNRGRKRAQDVKGEFEKEIEVEVEEPGESIGVEELLGESEEKPKREPRFYPETKTPIENGDGVKVKRGPGGKGFQGTIVEVDEEGDYLIIKSKGMEYRVTVEDIEPIPSTFKKMYM